MAFVAFDRLVFTFSNSALGFGYKLLQQMEKKTETNRLISICKLSAGKSALKMSQPGLS